MTQYKFSCGCSFPIINERIIFKPDISKIPLDCSATWDLICSGNVKSVFQLDTSLGKKLSKDIQPRSIEELADLVALARPSCLEGMIGDKSITQHYIDRKHNKEPITSYHKELGPILKNTYSLMLYQEQMMSISRELAGFDLKTANLLRKSVGKKLPELMAKLKSKFIEGCIKIGKINIQEAEDIFGWIEKGQRYSFCQAHSVSYSLNGYLSAYTKAHFPKEFITSCLYYSKDKPKPQEEIKELVNDALANDIEIRGPNLTYLNDNFKIIDDKIYFGLSNVKGVGVSAIENLKPQIKKIEELLGLSYSKWNWIEFLVFVAHHINKTAIRALISVGALSSLNKKRRSMLLDYDTFSQLTIKEKEKIQQEIISKKIEFKNLIEVFQYILDTHDLNKIASNQNRLIKIRGWLKALRNPPYQLRDTPLWVSGCERSLLGIALTTTGISSDDISKSTINCKNLQRGVKNGILAAIIEDVKEISTKKGKHPGQKMAFVSVSDETGLVDSLVAFPNTWTQHKDLLMPTNNVLLSFHQGRDQSYIIDRVELI